MAVRYRTHPFFAFIEPWNSTIAARPAGGITIRPKAPKLSNFFLNSEGKAPDGKFFTKIILSERFVFRENVSSFTLCVVLCLLF